MYNYLIIYRHHRSQDLSGEEVLRCMELLSPLLDDTDSYIYLNCLLMLKQITLFCFQHCHSQRGEKTNPTLYGLLHQIIADYSGAESSIPTRRRVMIGELLLIVVRLVRRSQQSSQAAPLSSLLTVRAMLPSLKTSCIKLARQRLSDEQRKLVDESKSHDSLRVELRREMVIRVQPQPLVKEVSNRYTTTYCDKL